MGPPMMPRPMNPIASGSVAVVMTGNIIPPVCVGASLEVSEHRLEGDLKNLPGGGSLTSQQGPISALTSRTRPTRWVHGS